MAEAIPSITSQPRADLGVALPPFGERNPSSCSPPGGPQNDARDHLKASVNLSTAACAPFKSGTELSLLRTQLRRIAIEFCRDISRVSSGVGDYVRAYPKTDRIDCVCCYASRIGSGHWRAGQYSTSGSLS